MRWAIFAALVGGLFLIVPRTEKGKEAVNMTLPRGIRNNNPGNIRHGDNWRGMAEEQPDSAFITFVKPEWGFRAMVRILHSYNRRGVNTLAEIINTWAPPVENNTAAYVNHVAERLGMAPSGVIDLEDRETVIDLLEAITLHENGQQPYSRDIIRRGYELA